MHIPHTRSLFGSFVTSGPPHHRSESSANSCPLARKLKEVRMGSRLAKLRRWPLLLVSLVLALLALSGGTPPRVEAETERPAVPTGMSIDLDPRTPVLKPGVLCTYRIYTIFVQP